MSKVTPCDVCGNVELNWDRDWAVSDEEWQQVVPKKWQNKIVCPWCFVKFAEERGKDYGVIYYPDTEVAMGVIRVSRESDISKERKRREAAMGELGPLRRILSERKTFILKEPLIKRLTGNPGILSLGNPDDLIEKYLIKERIPVPGPEVKRTYV